MRCVRLSCWYLTILLICVTVLDLLQPFFYELKIAYLEHRQIRKPIAVDHIRYFNSVCNLNADSRGFHQKVISYSIYGNFTSTEVARRYLNPLKGAIDTINRAFPGIHLK